MKDDGDHAIGSVQWMKALGKFVMRNVFLQMKDRSGGHLILLVGETYLIMKISNLLQHKLQSSHKDKLPLNFHLAFGTEHIHLITLTFVSRDFIFPRHRHSAKWQCHSMHICVLSRKTFLSRKLSSNSMLWCMSLQKSRCLFLSSFDIACSIWNMCKIRHNFPWCVSNFLLARHMEMFGHFFPFFSFFLSFFLSFFFFFFFFFAHLRLQLRGNRLSVLVRLRLYKVSSCSRTCWPTHGTLFVVFCPQASSLSCCVRTLYQTTLRELYAHCAWNPPFLLCDYPAPLPEGVENRNGKYKNFKFALITRVLPHIRRLLLFSVIYFYSLPIWVTACVYKIYRVCRPV